MLIGYSSFSQHMMRDRSLQIIKQVKLRKNDQSQVYANIAEYLGICNWQQFCHTKKLSTKQRENHVFYNN